MLFHKCSLILLYLYYNIIHVKSAKQPKFKMELVETQYCQQFNKTLKGRIRSPGYFSKNSKIAGKVDLEFWEDIKDVVCTIQIFKCKSRENPDTCEDYVSFPFNVCKMYANPRGMWKHYADSYTPPLRCPVKSGYYSGTVVEYDNKALNFIMTGDIHWKVVTVSKETDGRVILCGVFIGRRI